MIVLKSIQHTGKEDPQMIKKQLNCITTKKHKKSKIIRKKRTK